MDWSKGGRAIFSDKEALFSLWFHLINLHSLGVGVCGDNQGRTDIEKADGVDKAGRADGSDKAVKVDRKNRADGADGAN